MNKQVVIKLLPKRLLSKGAGFLGNLRLPKAVLRVLLKLYIKKYGVNMSEVLYELESYESLNSFFTRKLKVGAREIEGGGGVIVSPVDGEVVEFGRVYAGEFLQVKGIKLLLKELMKTKTHKEFIEGEYITIYLSPRDYHRIHIPYDGRAKYQEHIRGKLNPVNELGLGIKRLFVENERNTTIFESKELGKYGLVLVGALNVGSIKTFCGIEFSRDDFSSEGYAYSDLDGRYFKKGAEYGLFELGGSTVILFFGKGRIRFRGGIKRGKRLKMGEGIGDVLKS